MAKFITERPFSIEFGEETLLGMYREYTKPEQKQIIKEFESDSLQEKELNKIKKRHSELQLELKIYEDDKEMLAATYEKFKLCTRDLEEKTKVVEDLNISERGMVKRFEMCVTSDKKDRIKELAETYGYESIFKTIYEDLEEKKKKD